MKKFLFFFILFVCHTYDSRSQDTAPVTANRFSISSGCGPCIESLPELEEIAELYRDTLAIVSISIDPPKSWKAFVEKRQMKGNQWNELRKAGTGLAMSYGVKGYPHYVLIAPDGKIQSIWGGYGKGSLLKKLKEEINIGIN
ncbi:TlpA family protein disulfide reductase [Bacteroides heparinolyticus]|uniref:TlpA family protein disulfide reductase n=1 Tax=Prevotella heparinolytica TaxID=28113 RepID=UPI0035A151E8